MNFFYKYYKFVVSSVIILVTGCVFAMWLGEKITDKGIGNGISLLITVGIIIWIQRMKNEKLIESK